MIKVSNTLLLCCLLMLAIPVLSGMPNNSKGVQWMEPKLIAVQMQSQPRTIVVDVYTSWCYYCKVMDATTWKNDSVVNYLQKNCYAVKLNAEDKNSLEWFGKTYAYQSRYKVNELAVMLLRGNMVYPSTVIIPPTGEWQVLPGVLKPSELEMVLKYYDSGNYEQMDFANWQQHFSSSWQTKK